MAKRSTQYVCQSCGMIQPRWLGRCPSCGSWNTFIEESNDREKAASKSPSGSSREPQLLSQVREDVTARVATGVREVDRVLGGGLVAGSVMLLGGDPGVGKSTLLLQVLAKLAESGHKVLYLSGEESVSQVALRARRLGLEAQSNDDRVYLASVNELEEIEHAITQVQPLVVVVDSVQTVRSRALESAPGSVSQLREVTMRLVDLAKQRNTSLFIVGHVTKEGVIAGPKLLEHLVDVVLSFEGERGHSFRVLRATKNRFGSASEVAVFEMQSQGLVEVPNPSEAFLAERPEGAPGSVVAAVTPQVGALRAVLVEIQALVGISAGAVGRRAATGVDSSRLAMIIAVLERKAGLVLQGADVFVNVAGGLTVDETALDLPIALALASSTRQRPLGRDWVVFGEIGLVGEVRGVSRLTARLAEAASMGFKRAMIPKTSAEKLTNEERFGVEVVGVRTIEEALELALD